MLLKGPNIQLVPYVSAYWASLAQWFYDSNYKNMWRHHARAWGQKEFENYPQIIGGEVFLIIKEGIANPIGFVQMIPDTKTNRGFFVGILLDKSFRELHLTHEAFVILFNYAFNRLGYRKAIIEIVNSATGFKKGLQIAGFMHEGTLFGDAFIDGEFIDEARYSMTSHYFNKHYKETADLWAV